VLGSIKKLLNWVTLREDVADSPPVDIPRFSDPFNDLIYAIFYLSI
jgi:hypothetical protein